MDTPNTPRKVPDAVAGFTLIELIIVVAIIAVLVSVAFPQYQYFVARAQVTSVLVEFRGAVVHAEGYVADGHATTMPEDFGLQPDRMRCTTVEARVHGDPSAEGDGVSALFRCTGVKGNRWARGNMAFFRNEAGEWVCKATQIKQVRPKGCVHYGG